MTGSIIEELAQHKLTSPQYGASQPCLVAEHIEDVWLRVSRRKPPPISKNSPVSTTPDNRRI